MATSERSLTSEGWNGLRTIVSLMTAVHLKDEPAFHAIMSDLDRARACHTLGLSVGMLLGSVESHEAVEPFLRELGRTAGLEDLRLFGDR